MKVFKVRVRFTKNDKVEIWEIEDADTAVYSGTMKKLLASPTGWVQYKDDWVNLSKITKFELLGEFQK